MTPRGPILVRYQRRRRKVADARDRDGRTQQEAGEHSLRLKGTSRPDFDYLRAPRTARRSFVHQVAEAVTSAKTPRQICIIEMSCACRTKRSVRWLRRFLGEDGRAPVPSGPICGRSIGAFPRGSPPGTSRDGRTRTILSDMASPPFCVEWQARPRSASRRSSRGVGAQKIWAGTVSIAPDAKTGVHHHGELESVIYVVSGRARMRWGERLQFVAEAGPGETSSSYRPTCRIRRSTPIRVRPSNACSCVQTTRRWWSTSPTSSRSRSQKRSTGSIQSIDGREIDTSSDYSITP